MTARHAGQKKSRTGTNRGADREINMHMSTQARTVRKICFVAAAAAALGFGAFGCGRDATTKPASQVVGGTDVDLDQPMGGVTFEDEQPSFGEENFETEAAVEIGTEDPLDERLDLESVGGPVGGWAMTITWGILTRPGSDIEGGAESDSGGTDWSGSVSATDGVVNLRRTISFEHGDHIERPRTDPALLAWVSHTSHHLDGLRLVVRPSSTGAIETGAVTFATGPYSQTFSMSELDSLDLVVDLADAAGNQIHFRSFRIRPGSDAGFVSGVWGRAPGDSLGRFQGRLVNERGVVVGFLRGAWGVDAAGDQVLFGKVIRRDGAFRAVISGTWQADPASTSAGTFQADLFAGSRTEPTRVGRLQGRWQQEPSGLGGFDGVWCLGCP